MRVLSSLAAIFAALLLLALIRADLRDWIMLAGPGLAAAIILIFRSYFLDPAEPNDARRWDRLRNPVDNTVLVDGSNVMHWNENKPSLQTLRWVLEELRQRGFNPGVIFDANAGYKLEARYLDDDILARDLGLPEAQVLVVPKGTPADEYLLTIARKLHARVVTNDRFRDWAQQFPEVHEPGFLIRGGARPGHVWLDERARPRQQA